jgi:uncharacterized protein (TIGR02246 family)
MRGRAMSSLLSGLLALVLTPACARQSTPSAVLALEVKAAVDSLWTAYAHASDRKDAAAFGALFTEDATLVYSGDPTVHGREAIQSFLAALYAPVDPTGLRIEPEETRVSGSIAVQSGNFQESFLQKGVPKVEYGRFILIAEQGAKGSWRIRRLAAMEDSTR